MKFIQDIIRRPLITERSMDMIADRKYAFEVAKDATKPEIAAAIEKIFDVRVIKVTTLHVHGRTRRVGANPEGKTRSWKKAVVKLSEDSKGIEIFENMS